MPDFRIAVLASSRSNAETVLVAAAKAGELPVIVASDADTDTLCKLVFTVSEHSGEKVGISVELRKCLSVLGVTELISVLEAVRPEMILLAGQSSQTDLRSAITLSRRYFKRVFREVTSQAEADEAIQAGVDGLVAKGNEAAGRVGTETTLVLLQRLCSRVQVPVWAFGGIGPHAAGACRIAGASGIVLQDELALAEESSIPEPLRSRIAAMDGTETVCLGELIGWRYRVHRQEGAALVRELQDLDFAGAEPRAFMQKLEEVLQRAGDQQGLYPVGQGIAFAGRLAARHRGVSGILRAYRSRMADNLRIASTAQTVTENSAFAQAHDLRYPIFQGPMTRVSDEARFADSVSRGGALPFLALALLKEPECERLMKETAALLGDRPWGVGILAFVPADLRAEQLKAVLRIRPRFAILAGGRPEQASSLEAAGIRTYLHAPSAQLLEMFLRQGARRFIFEGRECGGHVGPLSSFVLWESVLEVVLEFKAKHPKESIDIVFAGGIHDARSAAMVAVLSAAAPAAGIRVGVLMGTAYLFTREAVEGHAIVPSFQEEAVSCTDTVLLDMGGGHAIRCAPSAYTDEFKAMQRQLRSEGLSHEEVRTKLEDINVGRLRIATKGLVRSAASEGAPSRLVDVTLDQQKSAGMFMMGQVAALHDKLCSIEELHQEVSSGYTLSDFAPKHEADRVDEARNRYKKGPEPVAVIGMACYLPGASDVFQYWSNILRRVDSIIDVPPDRWPSNLFFDTDAKAPDRSVSKWGGFMSPLRFDPISYGIPPTTLASVEPVHLFLLEVTRRALADAGYDKRPFARENTAVILGLGGGTWDLGQAYLARCLTEQLLHEIPGIDPVARDHVVNHFRRALPELTEDSFPGILSNVAAGRLANRFDLGGPNYTVDAACACSLAALDTGLNELRYGSSDVALVGAAEAGQHIFGYLLFSKTGALSPRGRCRPFDATADGIATSDGVAMVVLKRLSDAERDGDRIYSVIRSVGSASDGRERSLTAPAIRGQTRAVRRAYAPLDFTPSAVGLVEAHGTGTEVGDRTELETLRTVFLNEKAAAQSCALGSVKSQIGHTKGTAGLAGLIKVSMALHNRTLPPTLFDKAAPVLHDRSVPLYLNTRARPWFQSGGEPRRAAVNAFGFGGTNFHAVLEEYESHTTAVWDRPAELFVFRAPTRADLAAELTALEKRIGEAANVRLVELADALRAEVTKKRGDCRMAIVAKDLSDLRARLAEAAAKLSRKEGFTAMEPIVFADAPTPGQIAFLFPGQGSQYINMQEELALSFPVAREVYEKADKALADVLPKHLSEVIFPSPAYDSVEELEQGKQLNQTWFAQPALGASEYAMFTLLRAAGIEPDAVAGHSYGEYVALCAAGVLSFPELMRISERRGRVVQETQGTDLVQMVAIQASANAVSQLLATGSGVSIAGANAPEQTIVGGACDAIEAFLPKLDTAKLQYRKLAMSAGFHIPEAQAAADRFAETLAGTELHGPTIPVYSNLKAEPYPADAAAMRTMLIEQLTKPLRFQDEIDAMYAAGVRIFVEVGPGQVLSGLTTQILGNRPAVVLTTNKKSSGSSLADYLKVIGWMFTSGRAVKLETLFAGSGRAIPDLAAVLKPEDPPKPAEWLVTGGRARPMVEKAPALVAAPAAQPLKAMAASASGNGPVVAPPASVKVLAAAASAVEGSYSKASSYSTSAATMETHPTKSNGTTSSTAAKYTEAALAAPAIPAVATPPNPGTQPNGYQSNGHSSNGYAVNGNLTEIASSFQATMQQFLDYQLESGRQRQELMGRFLDTQRAMLDVFAGNGAAAHYSAPAGFVAQAPAYAAPAPLPAAPPPAFDYAVQPSGFAPPPPAPPPMIEEAYAAPAVQSPTPLLVTTASVAPAPAAPEVQAAVPQAVSLQDTLLDLIANRTGYPPEMLDLDQNLEADLGIDSIKRAEVFGALLERLGFTQTDQEREDYFLAISKLRTLREVLGWLEKQTEANTQPVPSVAAAPLAMAAAAPLAAPAVASVGASFATPVPATPAAQPAISLSAPQDIEMTRFLVRAVEEPLGPETHKLRADEVVLFSADGGGRAGRATATLALLGAKVAVVHHGPAPRIVSSGVYEANLLSREDVAQVRQWVSKQIGQVTTVCHFLPMDSERMAEATDSLELKSLFTLTSVFGTDLNEKKGALLALTGMGGQFGLDCPSQPFRPGMAAIPTFVKTLSREWPEVRFKAIDLDPEPEGDEFMAHVMAEIASTDWRVEVGYANGRRIVLKTYEAPLNKSISPRPVLGEDSVVLVTGGGRGITAVICQDLAKKFRPTFVLVGRSAVTAEESPDTAGIQQPAELKRIIVERRRMRSQLVTPAAVESEYQALMRSREVRQSIEQLKAAGAKCEYHSTDVRDMAAFQSLIESVYERHGRIDGVIHGSGIVEDCMFLTKSQESFQRVFDTKVLPAMVLERCLRPESLQFLFFLSSLAARYGYAGGTDYCCANEVLNRLAAKLDAQWKARVVAIGWGPWAHIGIASRYPDGLLAERGLIYHTVEAGVESFTDELLYGAKGEPEVYRYIVGDERIPE